MINGHVLRPVYGSGDSKLTLTATLTKGSTTKTITFPASVKEAGMTDTQATTADKNWLDILNKDAVKLNINLPYTGPNGSTIVWASSDETTISSGGIVNRPDNGLTNKVVTMTATITKGTISNTKPIQCTVVAWTDVEEVAMAVAAITWDSIRGNNVVRTDITSNLLLSATGLRGTTIAWAPTSTAVGVDGTITRPTYSQGDITFSIPCTVSKHAYSVPVQQFLGLKLTKMTITNQEAVNKAMTVLDATMIKGANVDLSDMTVNTVLPMAFDLATFSDLGSVSLSWQTVKSKLDQTQDATNPCAKIVTDSYGVQTLVITRPATGQINGTAFLQVKATSSSATGDITTSYNTLPLIILAS